MTSKTEYECINCGTVMTHTRTDGGYSMNHTTPKFRAGSRKQFIARVAKALEEYEQGRGATACMDDIKKAMERLKDSLK